MKTITKYQATDGSEYTDPNKAAERDTHAASCSASLFQCIVADPPWDYPEGFASQSRSPGKWSGKIKCKPLPYPSMTLAEIKALPVASFADEHCRLWMWTTNRYLPAAFEVMAAWGFDYRQTLVWHKADGNMGGSVAPNSAEFLLVGVKGNPPLIKKMSSAVVKLPQSKKHSRKPREWRWLIEEANPGPRLEMFARQKAPGWQIWGNELPNDVDLHSPQNNPNQKQICRISTTDIYDRRAETNLTAQPFLL